MHAREIEKLKFENKIKFLESENNNRMKIMQLEKDNQSLTHELELVKLKAAHEFDSKKFVVDREIEKEMLKQRNEFQHKLAEKDKEFATKENKCNKKITEVEKDMLKQQREFQNRLAEKNIEIAAKENELKLKLVQKDQELAAKENEFKLKLAEVENANKCKVAEIEKQNQSQQQSVITRAEKLSWGVNKFFEGKPVVMNLFASYQEWYQEISLLLQGEKEIVSSGSSRYVFIKRNFGECPSYLILIAYRKGRNNKKNPRMFYIEDDEKQFWKKTKIMLLHPLKHTKSLKLNETKAGVDFERWEIDDVTKDFFHGKNWSAVMFGIFNKNDD